MTFGDPVLQDVDPIEFAEFYENYKYDPEEMFRTLRGLGGTAQNANIKNMSGLLAIMQSAKRN